MTKDKTSKLVNGSGCAVVIVFILFFGIFFVVDHYNNVRYARECGWNVSDEEFKDEYYPFVTAKIEETKQKYGIECETVISPREYDPASYEFSLYNSEFTAEIVFVNENVFGKFKVSLYYFGKGSDSVMNYESQKKYVDFINEITHFFGYDTRKEECENHYERLFADEDQSKYSYHFDELVGYVEYKAYRSDGYGEKYMMQKEDIVKDCFCYKFIGILKSPDKVYTLNQ